jgi:hypothetical protein
VAVAATLLLLLASYLRYWDLRSPVGLGVFGVLLVVLSLFLSIRVDAYTLARRRRRGKSQILNRADPRSRMVKFILGGVLVPIAARVAANRLVLPNHQTALTMVSLAVRSRLAGQEANRAAQLGQAVLRAGRPAARAAGIHALETSRSAPALDELFRILDSDPTVLEEASEFQVLSAAVASYGVQAKPRLLQLLTNVPSGLRRTAAAPPDDGFTRAVEGGSPDAPARPTLLPSFVLQTFLQMGSTQDDELLAFARQTAADEGWSDAVRGQALQLTAKLGREDDLGQLYAYLDSPSPLLQANAMKAIAALQSRLSEGAAKARP